MSKLPAKMPRERLAALAISADEQMRHLTELTQWAIESGIDGEVTDEQMITLMRHQTALAGMILTLVQEKARKL